MPQAFVARRSVVRTGGFEPNGLRRIEVLPSSHTIYYYLVICSRLRWGRIYLGVVQGTSRERWLKSMKMLGNYTQLTIRISKVRTITRNRNDGHGYRYLVVCDEIPGCRVYGSTISGALVNFQKLAELWINVVR